MNQRSIPSEDLSAFLDGELSGSRLAEAERLLANDSDARRLLEELRRTKGLVASLPRERAREGLHEAVVARLERRVLLDADYSGARLRRVGWLRPLGMAAGFVLVCTTGYVFWQQETPGPPKDRHAFSVPSSDKEESSGVAPIAAAPVKGPSPAPMAATAGQIIHDTRPEAADPPRERLAGGADFDSAVGSGDGPQRRHDRSPDQRANSSHVLVLRTDRAMRKALVERLRSVPGSLDGSIDMRLAAGRGDDGMGSRSISQQGLRSDGDGFVLERDHILSAIDEIESTIDERGAIVAWDLNGFPVHDAAMVREILSELMGPAGMTDSSPPDAGAERPIAEAEKGSAGASPSQAASPGPAEVDPSSRQGAPPARSGRPMRLSIIIVDMPTSQPTSREADRG